MAVLLAEFPILLCTVTVYGTIRILEPGIFDGFHQLFLKTLTSETLYTSLENAREAGIF